MMLALKLLGVWRWLKEADVALWSVARRYPLHAGLIASLCLSGWLWWRLNAERARVSELAAEVMSVRTASDQAKALAKKQQDESRAKFERIAKDTANDRKDLDRAASDLADAHLDRMRKEGGVCRIAAAPASAGTDTGKPAELPAAAELVGIAPQDLRACSAWVAFGITHQRAAVAKVGAGLAVVE